MQLQQISQILSFPDGTPIQSVMGTITAVYPSRNITSQYGTKSVQNAELSDVGGNKLKLTVWGHQDLTASKGQEVVLSSPAGLKQPAIKVKHGSYTAQKGPNAGQVVKTIELTISEKATFLAPSVHKQANPAAAVEVDAGAVQITATTSAGKKGVLGVTVGMAINNACESLTAAGSQITFENLHKLASDIIKVSQELEQGNLFGAVTPPVRSPKPVVKQEPELVPAAASDGSDEGDVPY